ncbi:MAG: hypothetical protein ACKO4T_14175 [Planctomycetaceae bacterium]
MIGRGVLVDASGRCEADLVAGLGRRGRPAAGDWFRANGLL